MTRENKTLQDKIAVVTGAGRGLGEALAYGLAEEGAIVCPWDVVEENVRKTAAGLEKNYGRSGQWSTLDVTNEKQVETAVQTIEKQYGRLDLFISNAGILKAFEITEFPADVWRKVIEVNLTGYFICAKYAARAMVKRKQGVIIQINSKSGKKGSFKNSAYAASKFGGIGLTQSIALDLAPHGIRVNAVCPGNLLDSPLWVESLFKEYAKKWGITEEEVRKKYVDQVPLGRPCTYRDVVNTVVFLAGDKSSYLTGQAINVTGGQEMR